MCQSQGENMGVIETLLITTAIAGVGGTGLGGLIGAMLQKDSNRIVSLLLSFASGVMTSVVCFDLAVEAIETNVGVWIVIGAIAFGVAVIYILNYLIDRKTNPEVPHIDENHHIYQVPLSESNQQKLLPELSISIRIFYLSL